MEIAKTIALSVLFAALYFGSEAIFRALYRKLPEEVQLIGLARIFWRRLKGRSSAEPRDR